MLVVVVVVVAAGVAVVVVAMNVVIRYLLASVTIKHSAIEIVFPSVCLSVTRVYCE